MNVKSKPLFALSLLVFAVLVAFSINLYLELAGESSASKILFALWAVCLDGSMLSVWIEGVRKNRKLLQALAIGLSLISMLASAGSGLQIISQSSDRTGVEYQMLSSELRQKDRQIDGLQRRFDLLALDIDANTQPIRAEIEKALGERAQLAEKISTLSAQDAQGSKIFDLLANAFGLSVDSVRFWFLWVSSFLLVMVEFSTSYLALKGDKQSLQWHVANVQAHILQDAHLTLCGLKVASVVERKGQLLCYNCMKMYFEREDKK